MNKLLVKALGDNSSPQHRAFGQSLIFDNVDDYVRLPSGVFNLAGKEIRHNRPFTLEAYFTGAFYLGDIYANSNPYGYVTNFNIGTLIIVQNGVQRLQFTNDTSNTNALFYQASVSLNSLYRTHLIVRKKTGGTIDDIDFFINGRKLPKPTGGNYYNTITFTGYNLGRFITLGTYFTMSAFRANGKYVKTKIWDYAITDTQARNYYNTSSSPAGTILDLDYNASAVTTVPDTSPNGFNGTIFGQGSSPTLTNFYA